MKRFAIICPGFCSENLYKQPWYNVHGLALGLCAHGIDVSIFTDVEATGAQAEYGLKTVPVLFDGRGFGTGLRDKLAGLLPDMVLVSVGIGKMLRMGPLDEYGPVVLMIGAQRFRLAELARLGLRTWMLERMLLSLPLMTALVPGKLLSHGFHRMRAAGALFFSEENRQRYCAFGFPGGGVLVPCVNSTFKADRGAAKQQSHGDVLRLSYMGPPLLVRGTIAALDCYEAMRRAGHRAELTLLLRANEDYYAKSLDHIEGRVAVSKYRDGIRVEKKYLSFDERMQELRQSDVVLLPFLVTVSDPPIVTIETALAGCRVVVLATPGVSEFAQALGGKVAQSAKLLPETVLSIAQQAREPLTVGGDAVYYDWGKAVEPALEYFKLSKAFRNRRLVCICGADGSGKTSIVNALRERLGKSGIVHRYVWSRFRNYLSKPFLFATRISGHNYKTELHDAKVGYHDFQNSRLLSGLHLSFQWLDNVLDIFFRYRICGKTMVVGDRCVVDTLVDLAVDTGMDDFVFGRYGRSLVAMLPDPKAIVMIERDTKLIADVRPDATAERHHTRRQQLYRRLAEEFSFPLIYNNGTLEDVCDKVLLALEKRDVSL